MARVKQTRGKKRVRKNIAKGVAHVHSTFNNTIVTITDEHGNVFNLVKCWSIRFQRIKKINTICMHKWHQKTAAKASIGTWSKNCRCKCKRSRTRT